MKLQTEEFRLRKHLPKIFYILWQERKKPKLNGKWNKLKELIDICFLIN